MADQTWIIEALPIGVWVGRIPDGRVVYVNPVFKVIMGMDAVTNASIGEAPSAYGIFDRCGNPYRPESLPFSLVAATGEPVSIDDLVIHRPDGQKVNVRAFGYPSFDSNNQLSNVVVAFIDITKEVEAEIVRAQTEERLALAVDHAPIAIWSADRNGTITLSEGAGLASMGVESGQLVGSNIFELYKDHPSISGYVRRGLEGESFRYTVHMGNVVYDTWLTPMRNAFGAVVGVIGLSHDVSEVRRLQATAIQNDRVLAMGTLAASVAHEINNPLTYMKGHADSLQAAIDEFGRLVTGTGDLKRKELQDLAQRMSEMIEPVRTGTERIANITRELRTFSRSEISESVPVDVRSVVRSVLQLVGKEIEACARLKLELEETPAVLGSQARLVQVVLNLVVNAIQAMSNGHAQDNELLFRTSIQGDQVVIEVADSGPGVPLMDRERIFDPFVSTKEIGEGAGLGLFVCRNIVRTLGGDVTVSDRTGGGALFRVVLPIAPTSVSEPRAIPEKRSSLPEPRQRHRILIIDDDVLVAGVFRAQLCHCGYDVEHEHDAARALERLLNGGPKIDLVFCDVMMKGTSGLDFADALERRDPSMLDKVVFMTGGAFTSKARAFLESQCGRTVEKPFDIVVEAQRHLSRLLAR